MGLLSYRGIALAAMLSVAPTWSSLAAEPVVVAASGAAVTLGAQALAELSPHHLDLSFLAAQGMRQASFDGPLLWDVLRQAGAIDPAQHQDQVSQAIVITGRDGYRAVLALGEIAPEFEGKSVLLARQMDGKALDAEHLRIVLPGDKRGGRSVREVARIEVVAVPKKE